jgi:2-methylfumaryl-CoA hydratase
VAVKRPQYGRKLDDFEVGQIYEHPWEVTISDGMVAVWQSSFLDTNPLYSSSEYAQRLGFAGQVTPHSLVLNLGLSFSVVDVSQQAIAHLAYMDVRYPEPLYAGDTFRAFSEVLETRVSKSKSDQGTVHVRTVGLNQHDLTVLVFERKALIRAGNLAGRLQTPIRSAGERWRKGFEDVALVPPDLRSWANKSQSIGHPLFWEDFKEGDIYCHDAGRTVGESEHMMLTGLVRNTHPLHFDQVYCQEHSFKKERIVYGGLVLAWTLAIASRDIGGNVLWELGLDNGAHPAPVLAGDTLYAASLVVSVREVNRHCGEVTLRTVGVKNVHPETLIEKGAELFVAEREKEESAFVSEKVVEITRDVLIKRRSS